MAAARRCPVKDCPEKGSKIVAMLLLRKVADFSAIEPQAKRGLVPCALSGSE